MADDEEDVPTLDDLGLSAAGYEQTFEPTQPKEKDARRQAYLDYIARYPGYQTKLEQTRRDYTPKGWIKTPVHLPRFTNEEFEEMKARYQEKYGSQIVIPKFEDTIHLTLPPTISTEEYAAHKYAQSRGMPSPLDDAQLAYLAYKKQMFLNMLKSPEPKTASIAASIITALDAAQQALISTTVLMKLATKVAPSLLKGLEGPAGWLLLGADILNVADIYSQIAMTKYSKKRGIEALQERNPFSKQAYANRADRISKSWPTIGEFIQVAHTADHMFGVGLSLGAICGFQSQLIEEGVKQIFQFGVNTIVTAQYPEAAGAIWSDTLDTASALWASRDVATIAGPATLMLTLKQVIQGLTPKAWLDDTYSKYQGVKNYESGWPKAKDITTIDFFKDYGIDPMAELNWPILDTPKASIDDINDVYPPLITDNIQAYLLKNHNTDEGLLVSHQISDIVDQIITVSSDDGQTMNQQDAYTQAMKNFALANITWAADTPQNLLQDLADWIGKYERDSGSAPSAKEIKLHGMLIGIKFPFTPTQGLGPAVKDLYPGWNAIQDQLGKYKIDP